MLVKVKTLTGKEIEIDIEPNDKVKIVMLSLMKEDHLLIPLPNDTRTF
jgi:hypothetical protein